MRDEFDALLALWQHSSIRKVREIVFQESKTEFCFSSNKAFETEAYWEENGLNY